MSSMRELTSPATTVLWLPATAVDAMRHEAQQHEPSATGGILLGYWTDTTTVVVTDVVDGGPNARREPDGFAPDAEYQAVRVAELYDSSNRFHTYLGDWHSHPRGLLALSRTDRRTIRRISRFAAARCAVPVMLLVGGRAADGTAVWDLAAWSFDRTRERRLSPLLTHVCRQDDVSAVSADRRPHGTS